MGLESGISKDFTSIVYRVADILRRYGIPVSTSEIVDTLKILDNYRALKGYDKTITVKDLVLLFDATLSKGRIGRDKLAEIVETVISHDEKAREIARRIEEDLSRAGLSYGDTITKKRLKRILSSRERSEAYTRLKALGLIRPDGVVERVAWKGEVIRIARNIIGNYSSYEKALASIAERMMDQRRYRDALALISKPVLKYLKTSSLIKLFRKLVSDERSSRLVSEVAGEISRRIKEGRSLELGAVLGPDDITYLVDNKLLSPRDLGRLLSIEPRLASKILKSPRYGEFVGEALKHVKNVKALSYLVPKYFSKAGKGRAEDLSSLLTSMPSTIIEGIGGSIDGSEELKLLIALAGVEANILKAIEEDNLGYLDLAEIELKKIMRKYSSIIESSPQLSYRINELRKLLEEPNNPKHIKALVYSLNLYDSLKLLSTLAKRSDNRLRTLALYLMRIIVRRAVSSLGTLEARARRKLAYKGTRIDLVETFRRMLYGVDEFPVYFSKYRYRGIVAVLDKSGSMRPYSLIALLSVVPMMPIVKRLVLFDENAYVVERPRTRSILKLIDILLTTSFEGYTNVSLALREASRGLGASSLLLVSDLRQTIAGSQPIDTIIKELRDRGWRITIIAPPSVDTNVLSLVKDYAKYYIVEGLDDIRRIMLRLKF
ncbi:MAG: VWA domain-containing protein [Pyrodictiaceae archaeon]